MTVDIERLLDGTGWHILRLLQAQGRLPFSKLGPQVGLSLPAVAEWVRKLEDARIITGYRAVVDPAKIGLPITAFIRIASTGEQCARVNSLARQLPEVQECHRVTGGDSYIMKVVVASVQHLEVLIDRFLPYGELTTSVVLSSPVVEHVIGPETGGRDGGNPNGAR